MDENRLRQYVDEYWLGLGDTSKLDIGNPLLGRTDNELENPGLREFKILHDPEYLWYACKTLLNINLLPIQTLILQELWERPFPMYLASRGFGKSFLLSVLAILKTVLIPDHKTVIVSSSFRQAKFLFSYIENIWNSSGILRSLAGSSSGVRHHSDNYELKINNSYCWAIPLGDGEKIRGYRSNCTINDEFNTTPVQIYETVIAGFAAVSSNPVEKVRDASRRAALIEQNLWTADAEEEFHKGKYNQSIIAGTPGYYFQPFYKYYQRYRTFIESQGDRDYIKDTLGENPPENFNYKDYSIVRIPYELVPEGFMDDKVVSRARATSSTSIYASEYGACFIEDSDGFFRRSLLEKCVCNNQDPILLHGSDEPVSFDPVIHGDHERKYVYGIDPASEQDNFALVILEQHANHSRIVYVWTTNKKDFKNKKARGLSLKDDYYGFCARKIRELMKTFPSDCIAIDSQGGGMALAEALQDPDKMVDGEIPYYPVIDDKKAKDTDSLAGAHILQLISFANMDLIAQANHGMKKDFEDKALLFPRFDAATMAIADEQDIVRKEAILGAGVNPGLYDTLQDCIFEIEELKNELTSIRVSITPTTRKERFDTPAGKNEHGKVMRIHKDRYSAILIANYCARQMRAYVHAKPAYNVVGRLSNANQHNKALDDGGDLYHGPEWYKPQANAFRLV